MKIVNACILIMLVNNCATVNQPQINIPKSKSPQVSKSILQDQNILKRKVAIARFSNETTYGKGFFSEEDLIAKQAMDILSSKLTQSGKFILLERSDLNLINEELGIANLNSLNIPAEYLILGSVTAFGRKTDGKVGAFSRSKRQVANASVNIRLVEVKSGQIIYSEEGSAEVFSEVGTVIGMGSQAGYDSSLNDKVISSAISKLVSNIIENLLEKPWRSYILEVQEGSIIIAGGKSQGVNVGNIFSLFKKGKTIKNPQTGFDIELPGTFIGDVKVIQTLGNTSNDEVAICSLLFSNSSIDKDNFYIEEKDNE